MFVFFKQKTAYEMRISDWSSDVCSSDLMFGSLQSPAPVVDCLRSDGGAGHFWQTARSIGIAAQTSTFDVARRALLRSWSRGPAYRWMVDVSLLSGRAREMALRSEEHTSELQSLMRISYAVFCLKK